jgi:two-component system sensor histidine kinase UhpB
VELQQTDGRLDLRVQDDGVGFVVDASQAKAAGGASLGLLSMEERAVLAGGGLEIKSRPGQGTEVRAWLPLKWQTETPPATTDE